MVSLFGSRTAGPNASKVLVLVLLTTEKKNYVGSETLPTVAHKLRKRSFLGPKHHMTPPPAKKTKEVSGNQGSD